MKSKVMQLSTYDETNSTWRQPIDIGAKAANVDLDIGNGSVRNIQGAIGEYTDSESIAEKIGHIDRTISYDDWLLLSEEERNSGDWYIPDYPVSGSIIPIGPLTDMVGATGSIAGVHGLVPAPAAGDENKVLHGDGTWSNSELTALDTKIGPLSSLLTSVKTSIVAAINEIFSWFTVKVVYINNVSSLTNFRYPTTGTNSKIKSDMYLIKEVLSNPAVATGDWEVTTYDGYLTISGSISGTTNVTLLLMRGEVIS